MLVCGLFVAVTAFLAFAAFFIAAIVAASTTPFISVTSPIATSFAGFFGRGLDQRGLHRRFWFTAQPRKQFGEQTGISLGWRWRINLYGFFSNDGSRLFRRYGFDHCLLARLGGFLLSREFDCFLKRHVDHPVGRFALIVVVLIVVAQPGHCMGGCFKMNVRHQQDGDLVTQLDSLDIRTLFVKQEGGHIDRNLHMNGASIFLHRLFFKDTEDVERG